MEIEGITLNKIQNTTLAADGLFPGSNVAGYKQ